MRARLGESGVLVVFGCDGTVTEEGDDLLLGSSTSTSSHSMSTRSGSGMLALARQGSVTRDVDGQRDGLDRSHGVVVVPE